MKVQLQVLRSAVCCLLVVLPAYARAGGKEMKFKDVTLELQDGDRLVVSGLRGTIRMTQTSAVTAGDKSGVKTERVAHVVSHDESAPPANGAIEGATASTEGGVVAAAPVVLTVKGHKTLSDKGLAQWAEKFETLSLQTRREGHTVFIEAKGPKDKSDWLDWLQPNSPEMTIEVSLAQPGAAVPMEASLHDGQIVAQGWHAPVSASLVQGSIHTHETQGELQVQLQKGEMRITQHHGALDVDSFGGKLFADNIDGDIHLDNFSGESTLKDVEGNVFVRTHAGGTNVVDSGGAIDFELGRGALTVTKFEGPVRGQTENGPVVARLEGESDVNIESAQGPVAVRLPASSGAAVRLQTETGTLSAPEDIRPLQTSASKVASGRMKGSGPKGSVTIKSKAAPIRVRQDAGGDGLDSGVGSGQPSERANTAPGTPPGYHLGEPAGASED